MSGLYRTNQYTKHRNKGDALPEPKFIECECNTSVGHAICERAVHDQKERVPENVDIRVPGLR